MDPKSRGLKMLEILKRKTDGNAHHKLVTKVENISALLCSPTGKPEVLKRNTECMSKVPLCLISDKHSNNLTGFGKTSSSRVFL